MHHHDSFTIFAIAGAMVATLSCGGTTEAPASQTTATQPPAENMTPAESAAAEVSGSTYAIKFHRPVEPGYREKLSRTATSLMTKNTLLGQQMVKQESDRQQVELEAEMTVLEIDEAGRKVRTQYLVARCVATTDAGPRELVESGQTLVVHRTDPPQVTVDGQPMPERDVELLDLVLSTKPPRQVVEDDIYGSAEPRQVGETWSINEQVAATDLTDTGMITRPESLEGQVQLVGTQELAGQPCLKLVTRMQATNLELADLPPNASVRSGQLLVSMEGLFPIDLSLPQLRGEMSMQAQFQIVVPTPNGEVTVDMAITRQAEGTSIPLM